MTVLDAPNGTIPEFGRVYYALLDPEGLIPVIRGSGHGVRVDPAPGSGWPGGAVYSTRDRAEAARARRGGGDVVGPVRLSWNPSVWVRVMESDLVAPVEATPAPTLVPAPTSSGPKRLVDVEELRDRADPDARGRRRAGAGGVGDAVLDRSSAVLAAAVLDALIPFVEGPPVVRESQVPVQSGARVPRFTITARLPWAEGAPMRGIVTVSVDVVLLSMTATEGGGTPPSVSVGAVAQMGADAVRGIVASVVGQGRRPWPPTAAGVLDVLDGFEVRHGTSFDGPAVVHDGDVLCTVDPGQDTLGILARTALDHLVQRERGAKR